MKKFFLFALLMTIFTSHIYSSQWMHRPLSPSEQEKDSFVWEETSSSPFNELIVSWDATRPTQGTYLVQLSVLTQEWSPWMDYAFWGASDQYTFKKDLPEASLRVYQDAVEVLEGHKASSFRVRVVAQENASLKSFRTLHASVTDLSTHTVDAVTPENAYVHLDVAGLSQIALPDERHLRLCSPTSTTAVVRFLSTSSDLSPLAFADDVVDSAFDIYGNWILNTAQASHHLEEPWHCFVARLTSFDQVIEQLNKGYPVVVSIKGPLTGSALPYDSGHLLVIKGYNAKSQEVLCMDPAFSTDEATLVKYNLDDFLAAWRRRRGIAYIFDKGPL